MQTHAGSTRDLKRCTNPDSALCSEPWRLHLKRPSSSATSSRSSRHVVVVVVVAVLSSSKNDNSSLCGCEEAENLPLQGGRLEGFKAFRVQGCSESQVSFL